MDNNIDNKVLNFLRRRAETTIHDIGGPQIKQVTFGDSDYHINSLQNRKKMELELKYLLTEYGMFDIDYYEENPRDPSMNLIIRTIRFFLNEVMS